jgi:2-C-methyl-D-erythritol 4-phosphate cytidylyltransferase
MFRYELLLDALQRCDPVTATDESRAVEELGLKPRLVRGSARNFKVTYPEDLVLADQILRAG